MVVFGFAILRFSSVVSEEVEIHAVCGESRDLRVTGEVRLAYDIKGLFPCIGKSCSIIAALQLCFSHTSIRALPFSGYIWQRHRIRVIPV